jgi:AraC-like DNA-binding protein
MTGAHDFYREFAPPADLRYAIACLWISRTADAAPQCQVPIVPDGCSDILAFGTQEPVVVGPATRTHWAVLAPGAEIAAVRLLPGAFAAIFGCRATELLDRTQPISAVCSGSRALLADVAAAGNAHERCVTLANWVRGRLARDTGQSRALIAAARRFSVASDFGVDRLAHELGWSARTLLRQFESACGYGPKKLQRIMRLQRAIGIAREAGAQTSAAATALAAGYADQAHMTREFRLLTGFTPAAYFAVAPPPAGQWLVGGLPALPMSETFKTGPLAAR